MRNAECEMRNAECEFGVLRFFSMPGPRCYTSHFELRISQFAILMICHSCKSEIKFEGPISRTEVCPSCDADVHCCLNCLNYDPSAHNRCREPQAELVSDREKGNFCDFFLPNKAAVSGTAKPADEGRRSFESLFKK